MVRVGHLGVKPVQTLRLSIPRYTCSRLALMSFMRR
jgi:hypothetical protein